MTTVLTYSDSDTTRRCDGKCHNAKGDKCECICAGKNHGVGFKQAIVNIREDIKVLVEQEGLKIAPFQLPMEDSNGNHWV